MKKLFIIICCSLSFQTFACNIVIIPFSGGRFGNQCLALYGALWLKHKYGFDIIIPKASRDTTLHDYKIRTIANLFPFEKGKLIARSDKTQKLYEINNSKQFRIVKKGPIPENIVEIEILSLNQIDQVVNTAKNCGCSKQKKIAVSVRLGMFLTLFQKDFSLSPPAHLGIDWSDVGFTNYLRQVFAPVRKSSTIKYPPKNKICIALHYREGGAVDSHAIKKKYPDWFLPISSYITGLQSILKELPKNSPIYIGVFSDAVNSSFVSDLKMNLNHFSSHNIQIEYLSKKTSYLDDFFSMAEYDFLIRGYSTYATSLEKLGNFVGVYVVSNSSNDSRFYWYPNDRLKALFLRLKKS